MGNPQDGYTAYGSFSISTTAGADVNTHGCELVMYEVLTATSTPQIKAYGAGPSGTFKPIRYRLITAAGAESLIDPDTASGALSANDRIIVPNAGYDQIRIITTTGTATCSASVCHSGGTVYEIQKLIDGSRASDTGGHDFYKTIDLDESEEEVKATAGTVYGFIFYNANASNLYLKFYNATAANVTVGTTTPVLTFVLKTGQTTGITLPVGAEFDTAITVAATTGLADNDTGAPSANDVVGAVFYQ